MSTTATAYTYDELSEEAQKTALEKSRHITTQSVDWWFDSVYEDWIDRLAEMGYDTGKDRMWFSGFSYQGDGASFGGSVDVLKWLEYTDSEGNDIEYRSLRYWLKQLGSSAALVRIDAGKNRYCHRFTMNIDWEWTEWIEPPKAICQLRSLAEPILDHARDQALELYRDLESTCDAMMEDDYIADFLQANSYLFWQDGTPAEFK